MSSSSGYPPGQGSFSSEQTRFPPHPVHYTFTSNRHSQVKLLKSLVRQATRTVSLASDLALSLVDLISGSSGVWSIRAGTCSLQTGAHALLGSYSHELHSRFHHCVFEVGAGNQSTVCNMQEAAVQEKMKPTAVLCKILTVLV